MATVHDPAVQPMLGLLRRMPPPARERILAIYLEALHSHPQLIADALAQADQAGVCRLAHKLAGAAAMVADQPVLQAARQLEHAPAPQAAAGLARVQAAAADSAQVLLQAFAAQGG